MRLEAVPVSTVVEGTRVPKSTLYENFVNTIKVKLTSKQWKSQFKQARLKAQLCR